MKTIETLNIEQALLEGCFAPNNKSLAKTFGCVEVRMGFDGRRIPNTTGTEYVDFMTFDRKMQVFRCYEIKVSLSDLQSGHALSFYGHYNYLVVPQDLYDQIESRLDEFIPKHVGVLIWKEDNAETDNTLFVMRRAKKQNISAEQVDILKDSMIRSLFYKAYTG